MIKWNYIWAWILANRISGIHFGENSQTYLIYIFGLFVILTNNEILLR